MVIQMIAHKVKQVFSSTMVFLILGILSGVISDGARSDEWTKKADMPTPRFGLSVSAVNGKIYVTGGSADNFRGFSTVEEYDPSTDTWTQKADMLVPTFAHSTSVVNGKIYAIGGIAAGQIISTVEEYDPASNVWTQKTDMPIPICSHATAAMNDKIYVIGGEKLVNGNAEALSTVYEYDPVLDTWTEKAEMRTERCTSTATVEGKIYAIGGANNMILQSMEVYDSAKDRWTWGEDMPTPRITCASVVDDKIYAIGGTDVSLTGVSTTEEYDPVEEVWTKKSDMPTAREYLAVCEVDGKIYAIGGTPKLSLAPLSVVEEYTPDGWPFAVSAQGKLIALWGRLKTNRK